MDDQLYVSEGRINKVTYIPRDQVIGYDLHNTESCCFGAELAGLRSGHRSRSQRGCKEDNVEELHL